MGNETDLGTAAFRRFAAACRHCVEPTPERRPGNALNIEVGRPAARCMMRTPEHWPEGVTAGRWLASGGSPYVLGRCSRSCCPTGHEWCPECGHRKDSHILGSCRARAAGDRFGCGCEHYGRELSGRDRQLSGVCWPR